MFAIGYKYQEDAFFDFDAEANELGLKHSSLLPTKRLANEIIEDKLCEDYAVVLVTIGSVNRGSWTYDYDPLPEWGVR